jgi:repressor of nif and glnA expression
MEQRYKRIIAYLLRILSEAGKPMGGERIAQKLSEHGFNLNQRMVRNYLQQMDRQGLTINHGRRGREITDLGEEELKSSFVIDKVGFVASRIDNLTYQMTFSLRKQKGKIILNVSTIDKKDLNQAIHHMELVFRAGLGMGRYVAPAPCRSEKRKVIVTGDNIAIGTVCSVTINGILLSEGIHTTSRFGGLLELVNGEPSRFTEIINYDGSSIDPLEIFIKGGMTSVGQAVSTGNGRIGASFREVPSVALARVEKIRKKLEDIGLGGIIMIGKPNRPLLDIPVSEGRAGIIVAGGLNPIAAVEECGIATHNLAMGSLEEFEHLIPFWEFQNAGCNVL